ncbi:MAG: TetR/AcrR family transcriptional regulator [Syntrophobacteraceae bacterium]
MKKHCPGIRDPEGTRNSVLDAAQHLFAAGGFAGTSMRDIAKASGVSQPLIYHHFGAKADLYEAVKRRIMEQAGANLAQSGGDPRDATAISTLVRSSFAFLRGNDELTRLGAWSHLERDNIWPGEKEVMHELADRVRTLQARGVIRNDIEPMLLVVMVEALTVFWFQYRSYFETLFPEDLEEIEAQYLEQVLRVLQSGLLCDTMEAQQHGRGTFE